MSLHPQWGLWFHQQQHIYSFTQPCNISESFRTLLPTPLQKTKPTKKSPVLFILLPQLYPLLKVYSQITTFMNYLNLFFLSPFQCDCVIHLMYSSSVSVSSSTPCWLHFIFWIWKTLTYFQKLKLYQKGMPREVSCPFLKPFYPISQLPSLLQVINFGF